MCLERTQRAAIVIQDNVFACQMLKEHSAIAVRKIIGRLLAEKVARAAIAI